MSSEKGYKTKPPLARRIAADLAGLATVVGVALVLFMRSSATTKGFWDDLAVMRADAWLESCDPDDPVPVRLRQHFERYGSSLPQVAQVRYRLRTQLSSTYPILGPLVRALERARRASVLANVVSACRLEHLLVLLAVVLLVGWWQPWILLAVLAAALAIAYRWPGDLADWLPFQRHSLTWAATPPRGASTLAWFGAVVAWITLAGTRRIVTVLALLLASWLCHRSMALLCVATSVPPLILLEVARRRIVWPPPRWKAAGAFGACALLTAGAKLALLWSESGRLPPFFVLHDRGSLDEARHAAELLFAWTLLILATLELWRRSRARIPSDAAGAALRSSGDTTAWLFGTTAAVSLGLNVAHPPEQLWYGRFFFVWEASVRLGAVPNLLFFSVLALALAARTARVLAPLVLAVALLTALLATRQLQALRPRPFPEQKRSLDKLLAKRQRAYADEIQYYLSVGGEIAARGCGERASP